MFFQHGHFAEAYDRLMGGGPETYRNQRESVEYVAGLAKTHEITIVAICDAEHDIAITPNLRSIGVTRQGLTSARILRLLDSIAPDCLICRAPYYHFLRLAHRRRIATLPNFADLFTRRGLRSAFRNARLARLLSRKTFPCVSNHSINASRSVVDVLGQDPARVVPWEWRPVNALPTAKASVADPARPRVFFAGAVIAAKGVGDCLAAAREMHDRGIAIQFSFAGKGDLDFWRSEASRLGIADAVEFLGLIPSDQVLERMADHDIVVVPTRHDYAEGMPMTINEGLASRSALIISDHPSFAGRLQPEETCLVCEAANAISLADCLERLSRDSTLYTTLSRNAPEALKQLYTDFTWYDLIDSFLGDPTDASGWVARHSLKTLI